MVTILRATQDPLVLEWAPSLSSASLPGFSNLGWGTVSCAGLSHGNGQDSGKISFGEQDISDTFLYVAAVGTSPSSPPFFMVPLLCISGTALYK